MRAFAARKADMRGVHEPGVNVPFGRPETDGVQLLSLPLNSARLEGGFDLTMTTLDDVLLDEADICA
jgi:hypothetical protein